MHKKNIFITLLLFAISWGWSNNATLDTLYYIESETSAPDTIYVIETSTESEDVPIETVEPFYSSFSPKEEDKKHKMLLYLHPISLLYGLDKNGFMGFVTLEKEMTRNVSLILKPQLLFHDLDIYNDDWTNYTDDYEITLKHSQIKMGVGLRRYSKKQQEGLFIQVNGNLGFGHAKSIDSEENKTKFSYISGAISTSLGKSWKSKYLSCFFDVGAGLKTSSVDYENENTFEELFLFEFGRGFFIEMNFGLGFYIY